METTIEEQGSVVVENGPNNVIISSTTEKKTRTGKYRVKVVTLVWFRKFYIQSSMVKREILRGHPGVKKVRFSVPGILSIVPRSTLRNKVGDKGQEGDNEETERRFLI